MGDAHKGRRQQVAAHRRCEAHPGALPVPGIALRAVVGEFAPVGILAGQRAVPAALEAAGFSWTHPDVTSALRSALGKD